MPVKSVKDEICLPCLMPHDRKCWWWWEKWRQWWQQWWWCQLWCKWWYLTFQSWSKQKQKLTNRAGDVKNDDDDDGKGEDLTQQGRDKSRGDFAKIEVASLMSNRCHSFSSPSSSSSISSSSSSSSSTGLQSSPSRWKILRFSPEQEGELRLPHSPLEGILYQLQTKLADRAPLQSRVWRKQVWNRSKCWIMIGLMLNNDRTNAE